MTWTIKSPKADLVKQTIMRGCSQTPLLKPLFVYAFFFPPSQISMQQFPEKTIAFTRSWIFGADVILQTIMKGFAWAEVNSSI